MTIYSCRHKKIYIVCYIVCDDNIVTILAQYRIVHPMTCHNNLSQQDLAIASVLPFSALLHRPSYLLRMSSEIPLTLDQGCASRTLPLFQPQPSPCFSIPLSHLVLTNVLSQLALPSSISRFYPARSSCCRAEAALACFRLLQPPPSPLALALDAPAVTEVG